MTDRTSKILLAMIATGLWANLALSYFGPAIARDDSLIVEGLKLIILDLGKIQEGSCSNKKIC